MRTLLAHQIHDTILSLMAEGWRSAQAGEIQRRRKEMNRLLRAVQRRFPFVDYRTLREAMREMPAPPASSPHAYAHNFTKGDPCPPPATPTLRVAN
jgi:hypothetical protein